MFCTKCGQQLDDNQKFCHKCGASTGIASVSHQEQQIDQSGSEAESFSAKVDEPEVKEPEETKEEKDDDGSALGGCILIVLIGLAIWALVHFNPSKAKQAEAVEKELAQQVRRNPDALLSAAYIRNNLEYKDFWIVSWTYVEPDGHIFRGALKKDFVLCSVGFCGIVIPFIEIY